MNLVLIPIFSDAAISRCATANASIEHEIQNAVTIENRLEQLNHP